MPDVRSVSADVLVIGTGGAGMRAAIAAADAGASVLVLGKRGRRDAHTSLAAGGMNAALGTVDPQDSWHQHCADTFLEGYLLGHPRVVEIMAQEAPAAVEELASWGCPFARTEDGRLDQRYFGAHRWRRTCYVADSTGKAMLDTLVDRAESMDIPMIERQYVTKVLVHDGRAAGAFAFDLKTGERTAFHAGAVLLCTGGYTNIWTRNTSRAGENYGEGVALAFDAGCGLMDMELVQFHPTGVVFPPDLAGTLVTEAVRGEGGRLFNANGERYMARYDPERLELSTRDRVALANYTEIVEGRGGPNGGVLLDISHRGKDYIMEKLPRMYGQFMAFQGLDISKEPMEVAPTAHYSMGGVVVEPETHATDVPGLFAVGECAGGLHGANRLGGNSLTDIVVFGRRAGTAAAAGAGNGPAPDDLGAEIEGAVDDLDAAMRSGDEDVGSVRAQLEETMWECCGVVRDETRLREGLARLENVGRMVHSTRIRPGTDAWADLARRLDLRSGVAVAEATIRGALVRRETRGCHNRSDFPHIDPALRVNFRQFRRGDGSVEVEADPVPPIPEEIQRWIDETPPLDQAGRLLE